MPCALSSKHIVQQNYKSIPEGLQLAMSLVSLGITKRPWPLIRGWVVLRRMLLWLSWLFWRAILTICFLYFRLVHSVNTIVGIWNNSMSPFFLSPLLFSCSRSVSVGVCSRYFQKALHIFLEAMRSWAVTEETRHHGMPREALFVPLNYFRRHGGFLSAQKEQCPSNAGWHRADSHNKLLQGQVYYHSWSYQQILDPRLPLFLKGRCGVCASRWSMGRMACICPCGATALFHCFFSFPGLPWIMFFPYKFHLTAVYIETTQLWSAQGKKL